MTLLSLLSIAVLLAVASSQVATPGRLHCSDMTIGEEEPINYEISQAIVIQYLKENSKNGQLVDLSDSNAFQSITLDFIDPRSDSQFDVILDFLNKPKNEQHVTAIQEIHVKGYPRYNRTTWELLETVITHARNLETIYWSAEQNMPSSIVESLKRSNPSAKLYYRLRMNGYTSHSRYEMDSQAETESIQSFANSTNLYSLATRVRCDAKCNQESIRHIFDILTSCPNVRELEMFISSSHWMEASVQRNAFDFRSNPTARFPPLEVLRLAGYDLDSTDKLDLTDWNALDDEEDGDEDFEICDGHKCTSQQKPMISRIPPRSNIEQWLDAMNWSNIHTLHIEKASRKVLKYMTGAVPKLKNLSLTGANFKDSIAIIKFVGSLAPLSSLSLKDMKVDSMDQIVNSIIPRHSSTLKHLNLTATTKIQASRLFFNSSSVYKLLERLPHLETLEIDVPDTGSWDYTFLASVLLHRELGHLTLRFELPKPENQSSSAPKDFNYYYGLQRADDGERSLVNYTSAHGLFRYLRCMKPGKPLQSLGLVVGIPNLGFERYGMADDKSVLENYKCEMEDGVEACSMANVYPGSMWSSTWTSIF